MKPPEISMSLLRLASARLLELAGGEPLQATLQAKVQALSEGRCTPDQGAEAVIDALCATWSQTRGR